MTPPSPSSALPPEAFLEAVPKGISGRASYLQVCLAFHSVPRVIATFFNRLPFGPPRGVTPVSACPRQDHLGFGSAARDLSPVSDSLSLRLRDSHPLASPRTATRRFILQKTRRNARAPRHLGGPWFQVLFHSPRRGSFHLSLTVLCAIGSRSYSALDRGRPGFGQGSSCPALLRHRATESLGIRIRGCHPLRPRCPARSPSLRFSRNSAGHPRAALQPRISGLGSSPFARRYLGNLC